jgi:hypothetical protein
LSSQLFVYSLPEGQNFQFKTFKSSSKSTRLRFVLVRQHASTGMTSERIKEIAETKMNLIHIPDASVKFADAAIHPTDELIQRAAQLLNAAGGTNKPPKRRKNQSLEVSVRSASGFLRTAALASLPIAAAAASLPIAAAAASLPIAAAAALSRYSNSSPSADLPRADAFANNGSHAQKRKHRMIASVAATASALSISDSETEDDDRKQKRTPVLQSRPPSVVVANSSAANATGSAAASAIPVAIPAPRESMQIDLTGDDVPEVETPELSSSYIDSLTPSGRKKEQSTQNLHGLLFVAENKKLKIALNDLEKRVRREEGDLYVLEYRLRHNEF